MALRLLPLSDEAQDFHAPSVAERIALSKTRVRATAIMTTFLVVNLAPYGLSLIYAADAAELRAKLVTPDQRVIDGRVVMALLGATTVQLGAMAVIMAKDRFPLPG